MPAPQRLGKYQILRRLGAGAMGIVYEGFDPLIERSVALKVIRQDDLGAAESNELRARLRREAQAAGRLAHPGIVAVYEYGEDDGGEGAFIAMEMVRGRELKTELDEGHRFSPQEAVRVMRDVLAALQHAHDRGVVHRDIKPSNVFLQDDGQVKVADFGVARLETSDLTQTGAMIGTPSYMSPEQLLGQPVDGRSDLFSCGVVLYQLLTGEKPFTGSVTTVMHKVLHEQAAPPSTLDTTLIPHWDTVIERALAKQPAARYQNAAEFSRAIVVALAEMPQDDSTVIMPRPRAAAPAQRAAQISGPQRTLATVTAPTVQSAPQAQAATAPSPAEAPSPRVSTPAIATAVAALVAAASGGAWWLTRDHTAASLPPVATMPPPAPVAAAAPVEAAPALPPAQPATLPPSATAAAPPPAPVPVPKPAAPRAPAPAPVVAAPPAKPVDPWQAQRARVEAARTSLSTGQAMRLLLDVKSAEERDLLADFDRMLADMPAHSAVALGVRDGQLRWRTQSRAADNATASRLALQRCNEGLPVPCRVVLRDGEFSSDSFLAVTSALGEVDVATVRGTTLRAITNNLKLWREQLATAAAAAAPPAAPAVTSPAPKPAVAPPPAPATTAAPAPGPAPGPVAAAPTPTVAVTAAPPGKPAATEAAAPSAEWTRAQAALRASPGPASLADALIVMLGAQSEADVEALRRFGSAMKRLRWISALAMGESRGGNITYNYTFGWGKESWAQERVLADCARATNSPCVVVFVNGDVRNGELAALTSRFAARPQATVRRTFIESTKQTLAKGVGL